MVGAVTVLLGFGGFGAWAAVAPLHGAVIASGTVAALGRNKPVQHLEGGIVKEIHVREGDHVAAGEALLTIHSTGADSLRNRVNAELFALEALEARALAERNGLRQLVFAESLVRRASSEDLEKALEDQQAEFQAGLERHEAELQIMREQIGAVNEEISGLEAEQAAVRLQLELVVEERGDNESLVAQELGTKSRLLQVKRAEAELRGQSGKIKASIARARQVIAEREQEIQRLETSQIEDASKRLSEARRQRANLAEQLKTAEDALARTIVRAPESGTVINLTQNGAGAVLSPGEVILEIVPKDADLIVEAHVNPQDTDEVRVGQSAHLSFSALDQRSTPLVPGEVIYVSADSLQNERTGEVYYVARLRISPDPPPGFNVSRIGAGQPVVVFITTRERTFLSYLVDPIFKTMQRAAREN